PKNRRYLINGRQVTPEEFAEYQKTGQLPGQGQAKNFQGKKKKANGILEKLGRNLTAEAREGKLDPVIGRNKEIQETAEILSRRTKNNPVLVGDAGVGKTAVVEGLAQAIVHGDVPEAIKNKEIISIDISSLEAGTQYRGSFEQNIQDLVKEVKDRGNVILFFDEIHQILGAGGMGDGNGSKGMSDILKPALSRGEITVIGATTQDEYRNTIMKDTALARRFNEVTVNAPSPAETFKILKGIRSLYEKHHNVELPDDVLRAAIDYSIQYIPQRSLPDKAIDLLDMTAAHLAAQHPVTDAKTIEKQIKEEKQAQEKAAEKEDYEAALDHKTKAEKLEKQLSENHKERKTVATPADVAAAVERLTGIPVSKMGASDIERLKGLSSRLKSKVIGQDEAVEAVAKAIRRNRAGFDEGNRPIGSFLFVGPTGVGKTELAKQLALDMFGSKDAIIRLDMSEYSDRTAVSKLIGTTAGYVGYDDNSNTLTEKVRRNPYSIILLDEIEKADPQVITLLLQVLDDGRLTDGQGNTVNFKNTIIIATSNAGFGNEQLMGDAKKDEKLMDRLAPYFRPEFLNRFNAVIEFKHLTKEDLKKIVNLMLADVNKTLAKKGISLTVSESAKDYLIEQGYDEAMGARPLRRVIEQEIRDKVTDYYLDHLDVKKLKADMVDGTLVISEDK
ncbi:AAA family ATPase, partial [Lactobacillus delbrueckii]|uniref:AAA family ATPase n=1 Tax=Lactobacillus delbrueckii TaxID=1584 RepID=UPI001F1BE6F2